jgi:hypothetical protein
MASNNVTVIELADGRRVCLSYGVIVAAFIPRNSMIATHYNHPCGYLRTDRKHSVTTSRHANQFAGADSPIIPDAELRALCAPVVDTRG